jgi:hypothetical protein
VIVSDQPTTPFHERGELDRSLRVPVVIAIVVLIAMLCGVVFGASTAETTALKLVRAVFFASAFAYLVVSLFDFWEHFRLEKLATGRYLAWKVVPVGETINHLATGTTVVLFLVLGRPIQGGLTVRNVFLLTAPAIFLALGWRDELVYHRRRTAHREDIMHTVAHLAAGTMMATFATMRLVKWS